MVKINGRDSNHISRGDDVFPLYYNPSSGNPQIDSIEIIDPSPKQLDLQVKFHDNVVRTVSISWKDDIDTAKSKMNEKYDIPVNLQKLSKEFRQLNKNEIISRANIQWSKRVQTLIPTKLTVIGMRMSRMET